MGIYDVVVLFKQNISDTNFCGVPVVCLPAGRANVVRGTVPDTSARNHLSDLLKKEYEKTAKTISKEPWSMSEGADYLRGLVNRSDMDTPMGAPPEMTWIWSPESISDRIMPVRKRPARHDPGSNPRHDSGSNSEGIPGSNADGIPRHDPDSHTAAVIPQHDPGQPSTSTDSHSAPAIPRRDPGQPAASVLRRPSASANVVLRRPAATTSAEGGRPTKKMRRRPPS